MEEKHCSVYGYNISLVWYEGLVKILSGDVGGFAFNSFLLELYTHSCCNKHQGRKIVQ